MENYSKLIEAILKKLDWDHIMKYYETHSSEVEEDPKRKGKRVRVTSKNLSTIKKELKDLIMFVIESNFNELQHDNWIISWFNKGTGYRLEVIFTPTRSLISENEEDEEDDLLNSDIVERDVLKDMMIKSVNEENYELAAVIRDRLKKLDKIIKANKKNIY